SESSVIAGLPWHGMHGRDTFVALPGLTLVKRDYKMFRAVVKSMSEMMNGPLFPSHREGRELKYHSIDASLWFIWALQQYYIISGNRAKIWKDYGKLIKKILNGYRKGTDFGFGMDKDSLISSYSDLYGLTWMNARVNDKPVTPRNGKAVEINALWYNAVCFALELAEKEKDQAFAKQWKTTPEKIRNSFIGLFWDQDKAFLADFADGARKSWDVRPNQIIAVSLRYSPLSDLMKRNVLYVVEKELLTPRGLRSLSPKNKAYKGNCEGNENERSARLHQGTAWPWLLGHYAEAKFNLDGNKALQEIQKIYSGFEAEMPEDGIGSISEYYAGDPPYKAGGAISQAWNVAELLRMQWLINQNKNKKEE
ncbi:MAG: amylo-alpha-1,6-glucosidase, partial [Bacteroidales bacterium]|nr:amylo-alpha-1,6-glucosidase [Bacteroidales bacterium]